MIAILGTFLFTSCEETYVLGDTEFKSKLVVNSLFNPDMPWEVNITQSRNILDSDSKIKPIENALVEIFNENGDFLFELFHESEGNYRHGDYAPVAGKIYKIKVTAPGFKPVTASGYAPVKPSVKIHSVKKFSESQEDGFEVDFEISGLKHENNYFLWEVVDLTKEKDSTLNRPTLSSRWLNKINNTGDLTRSNFSVITLESSTGSYSSIYNSLISGPRGETETGFSEPEVDFNLGSGNGPIDMDDLDNSSSLKGYEMRIVKISKDLYEYHSSIQNYAISPSVNSVQRPREIYSNINNGLGVFAGYCELIVRF